MKAYMLQEANKLSQSFSHEKKINSSIKVVIIASPKLAKLPQVPRQKKPANHKPISILVQDPRQHLEPT